RWVPRWYLGRRAMGRRRRGGGAEGATCMTTLLSDHQVNGVRKPEEGRDTSAYTAESGLETVWKHDPRWGGIDRPYSAAEVERLRGSVQIEYTLARLGAERLWNLLHTRHHVAALGALSGNQAVQMVKAGLETIYLSGWQVAADANLAGQTYPDQSL